jgi:hypothetical protein
VATVDEKERQGYRPAVDDSPTTRTTSPSRPASTSVRRAHGKVSVRPVAGSTTSGS